MLWVHSFFRSSKYKGTVRFPMCDFGAVLRVTAAVLTMVGSGGAALADNETQVAAMLGAPIKIVQTTAAISPPTLRFRGDGRLYASWIEKSGMQSDVKAAHVPTDQSATSPIQVNPSGAGPAAVHQSPGFAIGAEGEQFVTWSSAHTSPGALFASDLKLARSTDGGTNFQTPVQVNDDGLAISHTFEHVSAGKAGQIYIAWLDGRNKDKSGAGVMFACSRDHGATVDKNVVIDGMACPCCRPMVTEAPDGSLWVAWRKTFEGNVRDIVIAHSTDQGRTFSPPTVVSRDRWVFDACPHRGPSIAFDGRGRLYIGWYTEGKDEQPRLLISTSDDRGVTFSAPVALHAATTSLPDNLQMAVHTDGQVLAVWEEVTGVRKRVVMRVSTDRGRTFDAVRILSIGSKAEHPSVAIHDNGKVAIGWTEHAFPYNKIMVQQGQLSSVVTP